MRRFVAILTAVLALAVMPQVSQAQAAPAQVRVAHFSYNTPEVDVFVDGKEVFSGVAYATTSEYVEIAPGKHRVQVALAADSINDSIIDTTIDVIRGRPYTLAAINTLEALEVLALSDSLKTPPAGDARVRLIHASPGTRPIDLWAAEGSYPLLTDQYFGSADYINIPAGEYTFNVAQAGTSDILLESQELRLEAGWTYTVVFAGNATGKNEPFILQASVDRVSD